MKLSELLKGVDVIETKGDMSCEILSLSHNDCADEHMLHFCYKGVNVDGHNYYVEAIKKGAVAFVVEKLLDTDLPQVLVASSRQAMSVICSNYFGNPSKNLKLIGITGTNGKTTCSYIISSILRCNGYRVGVIGTNGYTIFGLKYPLNLTTPDPYQLQEILSKMSISGIEYVVMEVSAHAIALAKTYGMEFVIGAFTNLTQDHLDFFGTMDNYAETKKQFLMQCKNAIINIDDEYAKYWTREVPHCLTYGHNVSDYRIKSTKVSLKGCSFVLGEKKRYRSNLIGEFNIYNLACSIAVAKLCHCSESSIRTAIKNIYVDGRFNILPVKKNVVIDYAHTPDGLEKILLTARTLCKGKIITVFGCGGDRDKGKRSKMGKIASMLSDTIVVTSDNPRYEGPMDIINNILSGIIKGREVSVIEDRSQAIHYALSIASTKDLVLICGKGAEDYQDVMGQKKHFVDREEVLKYFQIR